MRFGHWLVGAMALLAACGDSPSAPVDPDETVPVKELYHWPNGGTEGFRFLPSDVPAGYTPGTFDPNASPVVEICRVTAGTCGPVLATFSRTSGSYGRLVTVSTGEQSYNLSWPTASTGVQSGQTYRVTVRAGMRELGYADVYFVTNIIQYFFVDPEEYVPWFAGLTLGISFRIDTGIPGYINPSPSSVTVNVGDAVPLSASVLDLAGSPLAEDLAWELETTSSAPGPVAQLDSGWVVGQYPGTATVWTWTGDLMTTVPVTVTDTRYPWTAQATPDNQGNRGVWGAAATNAFVASWTGVLRNNGGGWAQVPAVRWRTMNDVYGFAANNVWAVGEQGTILRFNGTAWSALRYDGTSVAALSLSDWSVPARKYALRAVWGASASSVFAVGDSGRVLRYDGSAWTAPASGVTAAITDVWGSSATNVYFTTAAGTLLRWNGSAISAVAGVQAPGGLNAVWGTAANNVYAAGDRGILYRYDGTAWQRIRLPTRAALYALWGSSASNVFVGGDAGALYRWDGTRWTPEKSPGGNSQILGLWGSGTDVFAAGAGGLVAKR